MRVGVGVGVPFFGRNSVPIPLTVGTPVLWLDSSVLSSLYQDSARTTPVTANADPIGAWSDLSGSGNHAVQATAGARPTYVTSGISSLPSVALDGTDDFLGTANSLSLAACTLFIVAKCTTAGDYKGVFRWATLPSSTDNNGVVIQNLSATWMVTNPAADLGNIITYSPTPGAAEIFQDTTQWSGSHGSRVQRRNQAAMTVVADNNAFGYTAPTGSKPVQLGLGYTGFGNIPWNGQLAEVLIYASVLSDANRLIIEQYLKAKWSTP